MRFKQLSILFLLSTQMVIAQIGTASAFSLFGEADQEDSSPPARFDWFFDVHRNGTVSVELHINVSRKTSTDILIPYGFTRLAVPNYVRNASSGTESLYKVPLRRLDKGIFNVTYQWPGSIPFNGTFYLGGGFGQWDPPTLNGPGSVKIRLPQDAENIVVQEGGYSVKGNELSRELGRSKESFGVISYSVEGYNDSIDWVTIRGNSSRFIVPKPFAKVVEANRLPNLFDKALQIMPTITGYTPAINATVRIIPRGAPPVNMTYAGVTSAYKGVIWLESAETFRDINGNYYGLTLLHEMAHLATPEANDTVPSLWKEGVADAVSLRTMELANLTVQAERGRAYRLENINASLINEVYQWRWDANNAGTKYGVSFFIADKIIKTQGVETVKQVNEFVKTKDTRYFGVANETLRWQMFISDVSRVTNHNLTWVLDEKSLAQEISAVQQQQRRQQQQPAPDAFPALVQIVLLSSLIIAVVSGIIITKRFFKDPNAEKQSQGQT